MNETNANTVEAKPAAVKAKPKRNVVVWATGSVLVLLVAVLGYKNADTIKPVASKAMDSIKTAFNKSSTVTVHTAAQSPAAAPVAAPAAANTVAQASQQAAGKGSQEDALNTARAAFAAGDIQASVAAYQEYVASNATDADARGELGNVYYLSGNIDEAAKTYYDTANLLIEKKQMELVPALLPVIGQVNPAKANELMQKMSQIMMSQQSAMMQPQG